MFSVPNALVARKAGWQRAAEALLGQIAQSLGVSAGSMQIETGSNATSVVMTTPALRLEVFMDGANGSSAPRLVYRDRFGDVVKSRWLTAMDERSRASLLTELRSIQRDARPARAPAPKTFMGRFGSLLS